MTAQTGIRISLTSFRISSAANLSGRTESKVVTPMHPSAPLTHPSKCSIAGLDDQWRTVAHFMASPSARDQPPHHRPIPLSFMRLWHPCDNACDGHRPLDPSATNLFARTESKAVTPMHFKWVRPCVLSTSAIARAISNQEWHLSNTWLLTRQCPCQCPH